MKFVKLESSNIQETYIFFIASIYNDMHNNNVNLSKAKKKKKKIKKKKIIKKK
jgi:hypothetical protein